MQYSIGTYDVDSFDATISGLLYLAEPTRLKIAWAEDAYCLASSITMTIAKSAEIRTEHRKVGDDFVEVEVLSGITALALGPRLAKNGNPIERSNAFYLIEYTDLPADLQNVALEIWRREGVSVA